MAGEIQVKSSITKSGLPGADFVINPYLGCTHGCIYCYASFMKRFANKKEEWGKFLDAKINAPELIKPTEKYRKKSIGISSVTDPYQPAEKEYRITRKILEKLVPLGADVWILTKSDLIARDADVLKKLDCTAAFSISFLDEKDRKEIEPFAPSAEKRINALKALKEAGVRTVVFVSPIFPLVTDWKGVISRTKKWADEYWFENLNLHPHVKPKIMKWLAGKGPEMRKKYDEIYSSKSNYWNSMESEIKDYCAERGIEAKIYFHHGSPKLSGNALQ